MAGSPALLLLLALGLCCPGKGHEMKVKFHGNTHPQMGKELELDCEGAEKDHGIFWIRQDKNGALHFIVYINSMSKAKFQGNEQARFHVKTQGSYQLVVKSFKAQDEGNYFCLLIKNQMLYFSSGQRAFLPATTTAAPTTAAPTTAAPTTQHGTAKNYTCLKTPDSETNKWNFFCDIFIWIPLTGACLLLLIALVITILLCQRTRRRRCRCKRPAKEKPKTKPGMPTRYV